MTTPEPTAESAPESPAESTSEPSGWIPVDGTPFEPAERKDFDSLDFLADITHAVRGQILRRLREPRSIAELAVIMEVPVTRLYHHINRLEEAELIRVVATRKVTAVTERRYQVVARGFGIERRFFESPDLTELSLALGSLFDAAKHRLQHEVESGALPMMDEERSTMWLGDLRLTEERSRELTKRLRDLVDEFSDESDETNEDGIRKTVFIAAFPERD